MRIKFKIPFVGAIHKKSEARADKHLFETDTYEWAKKHLDGKYITTKGTGGGPSDPFDEIIFNDSVMAMIAEFDLPQNTPDYKVSVTNKALPETREFKNPDSGKYYELMRDEYFKAYPEKNPHIK